MTRIAASMAVSTDPPSPTLALSPVRVTWVVNGFAGTTPTGTVSVSAGSLTCTAPVSSGGCSITPSVAGQLSVNATYSGDAVYLQTAGSVSHQVQLVPTQIVAFTSSRPTASADESVTLQATVATALGAPGGSQLTFSRDACGPGGTALATRSVNSTTGVATWTTKNLPLGTYQLYACFVATGTYAGSQGGPINQTVTPRR